uniref:Uncharacterized protein n=1 Tax=Romanomermis culicivorax TaxID=13658 RepID=A0A915HG70_ROMCU
MEQLERKQKEEKIEEKLILAIGQKKNLRIDNFEDDQVIDDVKVDYKQQEHNGNKNQILKE